MSPSAVQLPAQPSVNLQPACDPLVSENSGDDFKGTVSWTRGLLLHATGVPAPQKQSTASSSNPDSSYCCWQHTTVASAGGIRWEWVRRTGEILPRPRTPNQELLEVADSEVISEGRKRERKTGGWDRVAEEEGGDKFHTSSDKARRPEMSNPSMKHSSPASVCSLCVRLSAPWGLCLITLMMSGMGPQHLLSAWHGDREEDLQALGPVHSLHHYLLSPR